tara:strand:- start:2686 stop:3303 length:618 start_codon:yes stop_codon:yes gene_type:complete
MIDNSLHVLISTNNTILDSELIPKAILGYDQFPVEFVDSENEINISLNAKGIVEMIGDKAREIILNAISLSYFGLSTTALAIANKNKYATPRLPTSPDSLSELPKNADFQVITQKRHKYPLTKSMAKLGWQQMMAKVSLITREKADELYPDNPERARAVYKSMRYPVHFWVSPHILQDQANYKDTRGIVWGKIKMEGKRPLWPKS